MKTAVFLTCLLVLSLTIASVLLISLRGEPVVVRTNLEKLPMTIAGFKATDDYFPESVYKELNADKHIYRHYRSSDGKQVDLYIGYYGTAKGGRTGHNPYACLPGAGWGILESKSIKIKCSYYTNGVNLNYILARKGQAYDVILHWYQTRGDIVLSNGISQNIQRLIGKVFYNRSDGAFVRVSAPAEKTQIKEAKKRVLLFSEVLLDLLPRYWPMESEKIPASSAWKHRHGIDSPKTNNIKK